MFALTTENGGNMVKTSIVLNYDLNIPYFAYALQLIVNKALKININIQALVLR